MKRPMYKVMLVTDQVEVRNGFATFKDWATLGFDAPVLLEDVAQAKTLVAHGGVDAIAYLLPKSAGQELFTFLKEYKDIHCMEAAADELRLRRELNALRRALHEREEEVRRDDVLPMLQSDFFSGILCGAGYTRRELDERVQALKLDIECDAPTALVSLRMPQGDVFLDEIWRYGRERLENALRNLFEREDAKVRYVLHVINPHHMRLLAVPGQVLDTQSVEALVHEHLQRAQEDLKEYFDLDMDIRRVTIYDTFYALCEENAQNQNAHYVHA